MQYEWGKVGQTRALEPLAHRQRVNVLGALRHNVHLTWATQQLPTTREDVIAFVDQIAAQPHEVPRIVLIDKKRRQWAKQDLYLYYLPPYSPELNRIEILRKHTEHFGAASLQRAGQTCSTRFSP